MTSEQERLEAWVVAHPPGDFEPSKEAWETVHRDHPAKSETDEEAAERYYLARAAELLIRFRQWEAQQN